MKHTVMSEENSWSSLLNFFSYP